MCKSFSFSLLFLEVISHGFNNLQHIKIVRIAASVHVIKLVRIATLNYTLPFYCYRHGKRKLQNPANKTNTKAICIQLHKSLYLATCAYIAMQLRRYKFTIAIVTIKFLILTTSYMLIITCNEFTTVKIHAIASDSLLTTNNSPMIQVHPSNGNSAKVLHNRVATAENIDS